MHLPLIDHQIAVRRRKNIHITSDWHRGQVLVSSKVCRRTFQHCWYFRFSNKKIGQWTPQAQKLYDLLIAIVSNDRGGLADLETLKKNSGLDSTDWEDLLQYTAQVPFLFKNPSFHQSRLCFSGSWQSCQLQVLWLHEDYPEAHPRQV